jgi:hypothetical protein
MRHNQTGFSGFDDKGKQLWLFSGYAVNAKKGVTLLSLTHQPILRPFVPPQRTAFGLRASIHEWQ